MTKFKVGDKVKLREGLVIGRKYNGWTYYSIMCFEGVGTITKVYDFSAIDRSSYHIDIGKSKYSGIPWDYTDDMLVPVASARKVSLSREEQKKVAIVR